MSDNWEHIIKNKLQNDAVNPPTSAWDAINDSSWTHKIKSKSAQASHPPVPKKLTQSVFQQNQIHTFLGGIGLKAAALIIGIAGSAIGLYYASQSPQKMELSANTSSPTEISKNPINPITPQPHNPNTHPNPITPKTPQPHNPIPSLTPLTFINPTQLSKQNPIPPKPQNPITLQPHNPNTPPTPYLFYSKALTHSPVNSLKPSELFPHFPQKKKSKPSHLKPNFSVYAGVQQRLNSIVYTHSKERGSYQHWPIQRDRGLVLGLTLNHKWVVESGIFKASAKSQLRIDKLPFYKTPIKINPQRKVIEVQTPYHQRIIDANGVALHPNGVNWRDTSRFYAISFEENHHADFLEIPLSFGYKHTWNRFLFSAQVGGLVLLPQKVQSDFKLSIDNKENSTFEFRQEKTLKNKILYEGFTQVQIGYYFIPQLNTYINVVLPGLHENNPNKVLSTQNLRFQLGINYQF